MTNDQERPRILQLYGAFAAALVLSLLPFISAAVVSLVLFIGLLMWAYMMRARAEPESLTENHATYIIRTIWIGGFLALITLGAGSAYLLSMVNNEALEPCIDGFLKQPPAQDIAAMQAAFDPCFEAFMQENRMVFIISGTIAALPVLLYFAVRFIRGFWRARDGYRLANPKMWL